MDVRLPWKKRNKKRNVVSPLFGPQKSVIFVLVTDDFIP